MEWPGIIRSGLFLSLYNQWLAGSLGDVLIRVKRCGNKAIRKFWTILTLMIDLQRLVRSGEAGAGQRQRHRDRWVSSDQTLDTGFLSAGREMIYCTADAPLCIVCHEWFNYVLNTGRARGDDAGEGSRHLTWDVMTSRSTRSCVSRQQESQLSDSECSELITGNKVWRKTVSPHYSSIAFRVLWKLVLMSESE